MSCQFIFVLFLCIDGKRIGCAFVQYSSVFDASRALKHMNGQKIQGIHVWYDDLVITAYFIVDIPIYVL